MDNAGRVSQDEYHRALDRRDQRVAELEAMLTGCRQARKRLEDQIRCWRDDYVHSADGVTVAIPVYQLSAMLGENA